VKEHLKATRQLDRKERVQVGQADGKSEHPASPCAPGELPYTN
jgi:hypothetical protein